MSYNQFKDITHSRFLAQMINQDNNGRQLNNSNHENMDDNPEIKHIPSTIRKEVYEYSRKIACFHAKIQNLKESNNTLANDKTNGTWPKALSIQQKLIEESSQPSTLPIFIDQLIAKNTNKINELNDLSHADSIRQEIFKITSKYENIGLNLPTNEHILDYANFEIAQIKSQFIYKASKDKALKELKQAKFETIKEDQAQVIAITKKHIGNFQKQIKNLTQQVKNLKLRPKVKSKPSSKSKNNSNKNRSKSKSNVKTHPLKGKGARRNKRAASTRPSH